MNERFKILLRYYKFYLFCLKIYVNRQVLSKKYLFSVYLMPLQYTYGQRFFYFFYLDLVSSEVRFW